MVYAFQWTDDADPTIVFHATLINWAGRSTWQLQADPTVPGRQQFLLTYPHLYGLGFDHKMLNHPVGRQVWRWDDGAGTFILSEQSVDRTHSAWGDDYEITTEDQLRWLDNEGETAFRQGQYEAALGWFDEAQALATAESWAPTDEVPDWVGWARLRRAQTLAYLDRGTQARSGMQALASDYEGDLLGDLAAAFLSGYGDGKGDAAAAAYAAMRKLDDTLRDHLYYGRPGALHAPMTAEGILCCAPGSSVAVPDTPAWPTVGGFRK